jgi:DNA mismatch endonuclease (patch repair protein)
MPKSRLRFWKSKLNANKKRDLANQDELKKMGWHFMIVWECELAHKNDLASAINAFLGEGHR